MKLKFQFNKTALSNLEKQKSIRENALPVLKSKEASLRLQTQKLKQEIKSVISAKEIKIQEILAYAALWNEFDFGLLHIKDIVFSSRKIAGVSIRIIEKILFDEYAYCYTCRPLWYEKGIADYKKILEHQVSLKILEENVEKLESVRRKTTQKVNLYEKMHIPVFSNAIQQIKRFLENEENIAKSAQKILKSRLWQTTFKI